MVLFKVGLKDMNQKYELKSQKYELKSQKQLNKNLKIQGQTCQIL